MYLISIYFDQSSNRRLQALIEEVAAKTGNTFMTENQVPPHLTIFAFETRDEEQAVRTLEEIAENAEKFSMKIVSVGAFFPYVLFAQPVLNEGLAKMQEQTAEMFSGLPETIPNKVYQPFSWLPHVTLGKTLSREQMKIAFEIMQKKFVPMEVTVEKIGIAKPNPHRNLKIITLK